MGCSDSKLDNLPAVALCRERCNFLHEALRHSRTFSQAHSAYLDSLSTLGPSLHRFFVQNTILSTNDETVKSSSPDVPPEDSSSSSNSDSQPRLGSDSQDNDSNKDFDSISLFRDNHHDCGGTMRYNFAFMNSNSVLDSKPPSPPPPPVNSSWDFLNLFDPYERYESLYVFDLEREDSQKNKTSIDEKEIVAEEGQKIQSKEEGTGEIDTTTHEVRVVNESSSTNPKKENLEKPNDSNASTKLSRTRCFGEVLSEIQVQFEKASESGNDVLKLLNHCFRSSVSQDSFGLGIEEDLGIDLPNLSSTLEKLLLWEKKLYDEVKAEEKLRQSYDKRCQLLKDMELESAEARKIQALRIALRTSIAKLKIAFQIVDRVSISINKLRDEELWPQIKELINRLQQMLKAMVECHKCQCQAILDDKGLEVMPSNGKLDNSRLHAAIQLKLVLHNWIMNFSNWIVDQRHFVKFLNDWLMKCLLYEPAETSDSSAPFSPSMIGAPPVFVICNYWSQAMDRLSEKEVVEAIQGFLSGIDMILEQHYADVQQILILNQDIERKLKILEREEKKMQKNSRFLNPSETIKSTNLQSGLKHIFVVMEKFVANSLSVYDDVLVRIQETNQSTENSAAT